MSIRVDRERDELVVRGGTPLRGRLRAPGDKSISHRALLFAAMAEGASHIRNLGPGEDVGRTAAALAALGARIRRDGLEAMVIGPGTARLREPEDMIDCGNSGTTIRLLAGLVAGRDFLTVLTGDASLRSRPMDRIVRPLRALGASVDARRDGALAPLVIRGGSLVGRRIELPVASAQVKSAVVLAGLQADGVTEVEEPAHSRDHTERMLPALGVPVEREERTVRVRAGNPRAFELEVPGDPSSVAFFAVAAALVPGSDVVLEGMAANPTRLGFVDVLRRMGADLELHPREERLGEPVADLAVRGGRLRATTISGDEIPRLIDELPVLAVAAAFAEGRSEIRDATELRHKESDRVGTVGEEVAELGVGVAQRADGLAIEGGRPRPGTFKSHGDHRVAMAAAVAAVACDGDSRVRGWKAVASSYPAFSDALAALTDTR